MIDAVDAAGYQVGLAAVTLLEQHFPAWYQEHAAHRYVTPGLLLGAAEAFLSLVNRRLALWEYMGELNLWANPVEALTRYQLDAYHDSHLHVLEMSAEWIRKPHPEFFGLGVQVLEWEEHEYDPHPLDAALWQLFRSTSWALGYGVLLAAFDSGPAYGFTPEMIELIQSLKPLPDRTTLPMDLFRKEIVIQGQPWSALSAEVVGYAFGMCENVFAQTSNHEIEVVHGGLDDTWRWDDLDELARQSEEGRAIHDHYYAWRAQVDKNPELELRGLEHDLHAAARRATAKARRARKPKTLINLLAEQGAV